MAIKNIRITVTDIARSIEFYRTFLAAEVVGEVSEERALLDLVTATFELTRVTDPADSTWEADDLQRGFRHIGFKVADVDALVAPLKAADVPFHLDPLEAEGGVRIAFFYDPDGTLLELVERDLQYHEIVSDALVTAERALGVPGRPRFDHVAVTVDDFEATKAFYTPLQFGHIGTIHQPHDPRGFRIDFLKSGDTVLEIFTYEAEKRTREPQLDAAGYLAVQFDARGTDEQRRTVGRLADSSTVYADPDDFTYTISGGA